MSDLDRCVLVGGPKDGTEVSLPADVVSDYSVTDVFKDPTRRSEEHVYVNTADYDDSDRVVFRFVETRKVKRR